MAGCEECIVTSSPWPVLPAVCLHWSISMAKHVSDSVVFGLFRTKLKVVWLCAVRDEEKTSISPFPLNPQLVLTLWFSKLIWKCWYGNTMGQENREHDWNESLLEHDRECGRSVICWMKHQTGCINPLIHKLNLKKWHDRENKTRLY